VIRPGYPLMRDDGRELGVIMQIQDKGKNVMEAKKGSSVAISIRGNVMVGRHFDENDILYTNPTEEDLRKVIMKFKEDLDEGVVDIIKEIIKIKQKNQPSYGLSITHLLKDLKG
ncbi:MAG: translation initiation factor IF-2, partial [Sulfolobales archaeon]